MTLQRFSPRFLVAVLLLYQQSHFSEAVACTGGKFGQSCAFTCHCAHGSTCNKGDCSPPKCAEEWEGYKCQIRKNVAKNGVVTLSSRIPYWNLNENLAVDGNTDNDFKETGSCVATDKERSPWLKVDLREEHVVQAVTVVTVGRDLFYVRDKHKDQGQGFRIFPNVTGSTLLSLSTCLERCWNRTDCKAVTRCNQAFDGNGCWQYDRGLAAIANNNCAFSDRLDTKLKGLSIRVGNKPNTIYANPVCTSSATTVPGNQTKSISCDRSSVGRYVFLQLNNLNFSYVLSLCEVMVKGYRFIECRRGYHGISCEQECPSNCRAGSQGCNKFSSACCPTYKTGALCEKDLPSLKEKPWNVLVNYNSITVSWYIWTAGSTGGGVGPVNRYYVQIKEKTANTWIVPGVDATPTHEGLIAQKFKSLKYNKHYSFRVACYLTDGLGDVIGRFTDKTDVKTKCTAPPPVVLRNNETTSSLSTSGDYAKLTIKWSGVSDTNSGCDYIKIFKVKYRMKGSSTFTLKDVNKSVNTVTISNLYTYTEYYIKVEAYNNNDIKSSTSESYRTVEGYSSTVRSPSLTSPSPDKLLASWNAPALPRGVITEYRLQYRQVAIADCDNTVLPWSNQTSVKEGTQHEFSGLDQYRKYKVRIIPVNRAGEGAHRDVVGYTAESVPTGVPTSVKSDMISARSATMTWRDVPCSERNGLIISYQYHVVGLQYHNLTQVINTKSATLSTIVEALTPYAQYSFKVTAVTKVGAGTAYSSEVRFQTLEDVPLPPQNLAIRNTQPTSVDVTWFAPYPPYGEIQMYQIQYKKEYEDPGNQTVEANVTSLHIENLETNVTYSIRARAKTMAGWGEWSMEVDGFTEEGIPSEPLLFTLTDRKVESLSFSWEEPKYPNGKITEYKLDCNGRSTTVAGASRKTTLTRLTPGSLYKCTVIAKTNAGYGVLSTTISAWTLPEPLKLSVIPTTGEEVKITDTTITFNLPVFSNSKINDFEVHVDRDYSNRKKRASFNERAENFTSCRKNPDQRDVYITARLTPEEAKGAFTVGDNKQYAGVWNCPLVKDNTYSIFYAAVVKSLNGDKARSFVPIGTYKAEFRAPTTDDFTIIIVACVSALAAVCIIVGVSVYLARRKKKKVPTATLR